MKTAEQIRLAYRVLDFIEAHPEKHDQDTWIWRSGLYFVPMGLDDVVVSCGTTACVAGWTVLLAGRSIVSRYQCRDRAGSVSDIPTEAMELLGLTYEEEFILFHAADLPEVREVFPEIFGPRPDGAM